MGLIIVSFNLHANFWSFQILVLYYPHNICVLGVAVTSLYLPQPIYVFSD